ncbi:purine-binding chemotaxis protein CheW [Silvimonas terrae]|uniref:Purine-binding chemotaxis protein CheW n=1 Tax=Silvimonas terrae TaxID=300266 RepID=A0A840RDT0_9NEIS|nr:chemotaxis protein CheW [Silvimonas terrae]MBB5190744.1 purine-binding chemotaxis protein CheW [Silvimonas terrae]
MSQHKPEQLAGLARLREDFDQSFAQAPERTRHAIKGFLAIRVGADPYALPLDEISGLSADRHIVPLPTPVTALRGLAGFRGQIVPVYDLGCLLGHAPAAHLRWLVLINKEQPVALAFATFEAYLRVDQHMMVDPGETAPETAEHHPQTIGAVRGDGLRPILHIPALIETIRRLSQRITPPPATPQLRSVKP